MFLESLPISQINFIYHLCLYVARPQPRRHHPMGIRLALLLEKQANKETLRQIIQTNCRYGHFWDSEIEIGIVQSSIADLSEIVEIVACQGPVKSVEGPDG